MKYWYLRFWSLDALLQRHAELMAPRLKVHDDYYAGKATMEELQAIWHPTNAEIEAINCELARKRGQTP
jgi:hypothetical protein